MILIKRRECTDCQELERKQPKILPLDVLPALISTEDDTSLSSHLPDLQDSVTKQPTKRQKESFPQREVGRDHGEGVTRELRYAWVRTERGVHPCSPEKQGGCAGNLCLLWRLQPAASLAAFREHPERCRVPASSGKQAERHAGSHLRQQEVGVRRHRGRKTSIINGPSNADWWHLIIVLAAL